MNTIKRIIDVKPSSNRGYVVCEVRYPNGRAETVEITASEYRLHRMKEDFDDANYNMKLIHEFEKEAFAHGYAKAIEDQLRKVKEEKRKCGIISSLRSLFMSHSRA